MTEYADLSIIMCWAEHEECGKVFCFSVLGTRNNDDYMAGGESDG